MDFRLSILRLRAALFIIALTLCASPALPARAADDALYGIVQQTIAVPFKPVSVYALVDFGKGKINQFPGTFVPYQSASGDDRNSRVAVAAVVPLPVPAPPSDQSFRFTFFLASLDGEFAATEVADMTWDQLQQVPHSVEAINAEIEQLQKRIPQQKEKNSVTQKKFTELRDKASQIAQVDDLLDLRSELENLKGNDDKKSDEVDHIREAIRLGYRTPASPAVDAVRLDLLGQLYAAARVTAFVDREADLKRSSAEMSYQRKLELIRETENLDPDALAQEALQLRERRRALERQLHENGGEEDRDF